MGGEIPKKIKPFLFLTLSERYPEKIFRISRIPAINPLISPIAIPLPPKETINKGKIARIVSLEKSLIRLTSPKNTIFNIFIFCSLSSFYKHNIKNIAYYLNTSYTF